jgi:hypothetical protein
MASKCVHACRECGQEHRAKGLFCCTPCRTVWNNRRKQRGAELYDFFMEIRHNRAAATEKGLWQKMCRLATDYKTEDERTRGGRRSHRTIAEFLPEREARLTAVAFQDNTGRRRGKRS